MIGQKFATELKKKKKEGKTRRKRVTRSNATWPEAEATLDKKKFI